MPRRIFEKCNPKIVRGIGSVEFFKSDVDYIQTHGYSVAAVMREALHNHVAAMQEREALPVMDKDTRESFILKGRLPRGVRYTEKKDPGVYFNPDPAPKIVFHQDKFSGDLAHERPGPSAAVMLSWSKQDRDTYILTGQVPA